MLRVIELITANKADHSHLDACEGEMRHARELHYSSRIVVLTITCIEQGPIQAVSVFNACEWERVRGFVW